MGTAVGGGGGAVGCGGSYGCLCCVGAAMHGPSPCSQEEPQLGHAELNSTRGAPPLPSQRDPQLCPRDAPLPPPRSVPTTPCYSCRKMPPRAHAGAVLVLLSLSFGLAAGE